MGWAALFSPPRVQPVEFSWPLENLLISRYQWEVPIYGSGNDEPVGGVAMKVFKLA